jgi:hypothetical protein
MCWDPRRFGDPPPENLKPRCIGGTYSGSDYVVGNPFYAIGQCSGGDSSTDGYLVGPNQKSSGFSQEEIQSTCIVCGDGIRQIGEECDRGTNNGSPNSDCDTNCKLIIPASIQFNSC